MNRWKTGLILLTSCLVLAACGEDKKDNKPQPQEPECTGDDCEQSCTGANCNTTTTVLPKIVSIAPTSGNAGTSVTITGENLSGTEKVCFGSNCVVPDAKTDKSVTAKAPDGEKGKAVNVAVLVGGKLTQVGLFTYLPDSESVVLWCQLKWVEPNIASGDAIGVYTEVYKDKITGITGSHNGLQVQIGYADEMVTDLEKYNWTSPVKRNEGFSNANNDEYMADNVKLPDGSYKIAARASLDGKNWIACEQAQSTGNRVEIRPVPPKPVDWCRITWPESGIKNNIGEDTPEIYAQAHVADCTNYQTHCQNLKAQVGYGPLPLADLSRIDKEFTWKDAELNTAYDGSKGTEHDEFHAKLKTDKAGEYGIAYRFSTDGGTNWYYCDTSDTLNFDPQSLLSWQVGDPRPGDHVEWCQITSPESVTVRLNQGSAEIKAQAYVRNCTGAPYDKCPNLKGQAIYGTKAEWEAEDKSKLRTVDAVIDTSLPACNNTQFEATIKPMQNADKPEESVSPGEYLVAYRFSLDGQTWAYCDRAGEVDGEEGEDFDEARGVKMTVTPDEDTIDFCRIQYPGSATIKGGESATFYGRVYSEGCTDGDKHCESVKAQVGYGPKGGDKEGAEFHYVDATYNADHKGDNDDEYAADLTVGDPGGYDVVYRFSTNGGQTWTYCDFDEKPGFVAENVASLYVKDPNLHVEYCKLLTQTQEVSAGGITPAIEAEVYVPECTENKQRCTNLTGHIGIGSAENASDFNFTNDATFVRNEENNNIFSGTIKAPKAVGEYGYVYAFSLDGDETFVYCGKDGMKTQKDALGPADFGKLAVKEPPKLEVNWCQIQWPQEDISILENGTADVYGRVLVEGCTNVAGGCEGKLFAQVGYGAKDETDASKFTYFDGTKTNTGANLGQNEEYMATLHDVPKGDYALAYRFSLDGENWTYCDRDNYTAGYDKNNTIGLHVSEVPEREVSWCRVFLPDNASSITLKSGEQSAPIRIQVYVNQCTESDGAGCTDLKLHRAYGTGNELNATNYPDVTLGETEYGYNAQIGYNDEYSTTVAIANDSANDTTYNLLYGFSLGDGAVKWCSLADSTEFRLDDAAKVKVKTSQKRVTWCETYLDNGDNGRTIRLGHNESHKIYSQAYVEGCTGQDAPCNVLVPVVAYGNGDDINTYNQMSLSADYEKKVGQNDEYATVLKWPNYSGQMVDYNVVVGFRTKIGEDQTSEITWCPSSNLGNPVDKAAKVFVERAIPWCKLFFKDEAREYTVESGTKVDDIWAQVYIPGCTDTTSGQCKEIDAGNNEKYAIRPVVAYGSGTDVSTFTRSSDSEAIGFQKEDGNNDVYQAHLKLDNPTSNDEVVRVAVGFYVDDNSDQEPSITWCDLDGNHDIEGNSLGKITVKGGLPKVAEWGDGPGNYKCGIGLDYDGTPNAKYSTGVAEEYNIYGAIWINGCTDEDKKPCALVTGAQGYYHLGKPSSWKLGDKSWVSMSEAVLVEGNADNKNNVVYKTTQSYPQEGDYYFYYTFGLLDKEHNVSQTVQCFAAWKSPLEATVDDLGVATIAGKTM